jgi:C_GCAxxG_C_C family probable redox protein
VGQEKMNMKDDAAVKAVGAYGGGIASSGNVCGTLLGGIAMISSIYSRANLEEKEDPRIWALSKKFMKEFEKLTESFGGINCCDIARVDWKDRDAVKAYYKDPDSNRKACIQVIGDASYVLGVLLDQEADEKIGKP